MLTDVGQLQFSGMTWFSNYLFNRKLVGKSLKGKTASAGPRYASSNCQDCKLNLAEICACVRSSILATYLLYVSVSLLQICKSGFCIKLKLPRIELLTTMKKTNLTIFNFFYGSQPQPFQPFWGLDFHICPDSGLQNPSILKRKPLSLNPYCALSSSAFFHLDALVKMCEVRVQLQNNCYKELPAAVSVERSLGSHPVANAGTQSGKCFVCNWQIADKQPKLVLERAFETKKT